jgi:hypothetical protein
MPRALLQLDDDRSTESVPTVRVLERVQLVEGVPEARLSSEVEAAPSRLGVAPTPFIKQPSERFNMADRYGGRAVESPSGAFDQFPQRSLRVCVTLTEVASVWNRGDFLF